MKQVKTYWKSMAQICFLSLILFSIWQSAILIFQLPFYILPSPYAVLKTIYHYAPLLMHEAIPTIYETIVGLMLGILLGMTTAFFMSFSKTLSWTLLPLLLISQALPTFAIAPLLVIWFGYGAASKIATTIIMLFFPITSGFYDGLRQTQQDWLMLANSMKASRIKIYWHIRIPAALPSLASGLRVATAIAPIGAIVGEWVGSSHGLGFLMLNANARMQIDLMFAALLILIIFSLLIYFLVDHFLKKIIYWNTL